VSHSWSSFFSRSTGVPEIQEPEYDDEVDFIPDYTVFDDLAYEDMAEF
jgi:hypothetical protein